MMRWPVALAAILAACSWMGSKQAEYVSSTEHPPLQVPAGLDRPEGPSQVTIAMPNMRKPAGDELEPPPPRVASTAGHNQIQSSSVIIIEVVLSHGPVDFRHGITDGLAQAGAAA